MKNEKKSSGKTSLLAASIIAGAMSGLSTFNADAADLFNYSSLGTGAELRSELLSSNTGSSKVNELECGGKTADSTHKGKAGENKCGDKNKKKSTGNAATGQKGKTNEGKCGEGKCGDSKKK